MKQNNTDRLAPLGYALALLGFAAALAAWLGRQLL